MVVYAGPSFGAYDGAAWRGPMQETHVYDAVAWRDLDQMWTYDGAVWRKIFQKSAGCSCTGVTIDSFEQQDDVAGCTCGTRVKLQTVTVRWTSTGATDPCHHVRVESSSSGASYTSVATGISVSGATGSCSVFAYEGCWTTGLCYIHQYYWRIKIELDSDDTVCATSSASQANNCLV